MDDVDESALGRFSRDDERRPAFGCDIHEASQAQVDPAAGLFLFAMAMGAVLLENRTYILLKGQGWGLSISLDGYGEKERRGDQSHSNKIVSCDLAANAHLRRVVARSWGEVEFRNSRNISNGRNI